MNSLHVRLGASLVIASMVLGSTSVVAQDAPIAPEASPEVYKIIAENDQWRVLEATWQPGQEDTFHSHPADRVSVYGVDCQLQITNPDGSQREASPKAGKARVWSGKPTASHKAKNIGDKICVMHIIELK